MNGKNTQITMLVTVTYVPVAMGYDTLMSSMTTPTSSSMVCSGTAMAIACRRITTTEAPVGGGVGGGVKVRAVRQQLSSVDYWESGFSRVQELHFHNKCHATTGPVNTQIPS